ncbi:hypothetical protein [Paenibacillus sp. y28]|uniref:hypothetical protein n=1 Tax=Paenibacillus sp. y28 TaxID=3129110 RepID=UPI003019D489
MRITCYYDYSYSMGYIYLKPPAVHEEAADHELYLHLNPDQISIPYNTSTSLAAYLDQIPVAAPTFQADDQKGYNTEYANDMDKHGYLTGIELNLHPERFIDLVKNQAFQLIQTEWRNREFHVMTLDQMDNVLNPENVIYKLTDEEDAFVIIRLEEPAKLGNHYTNGENKRVPIASFKALISARDDIYPLEYLLKPDFVMRKDM